MLVTPTARWGPNRDGGMRNSGTKTQGSGSVPALQSDSTTVQSSGVLLSASIAEHRVVDHCRQPPYLPIEST